MAKKDNFDFETESKFKPNFNFDFIKNLSEKQKQTILTIAIVLVAVIIVAIIAVLILGGNSGNSGNGGNSGGNIGDNTVGGVDTEDIESITLSSPPTKTVYFVGEDPDYSGLAVTLKTTIGTIYEHYDNYAEAFEFSGFDSSEPVEEQIIFVQYKGYEFSFSISIVEIPAATPVLKSISIDPMPKTVYKVNGTFIALNAKIIATYSDGSVKTIALQKSHLVGYAEAIKTPGEHEIKVMYFDDYGGYAETSFTITVTE